MATACEELAQVADAIAAEQPAAGGRALLVELGARAAAIPRGRLAILELALGGRSRIAGGGFRPELRDRSAGQARHFAGTARAVTVLGAERTRWLGVHLRRDTRDSPDGRLSELAVEFATALLDGTLAPDGAGDWIRSRVCSG